MIKEEFVIKALNRVLTYYVEDELLREHADSDFWCLIQAQEMNERTKIVKELDKKER